MQGVVAFFASCARLGRCRLRRGLLNIPITVNWIKVRTASPSAVRGIVFALPNGTVYVMANVAGMQSHRVHELAYFFSLLFFLL